MLGLWVFKRMVGHLAINRCIFDCTKSAPLPVKRQFCLAQSSMMWMEKMRYTIQSADGRKNGCLIGTLPRGGWAPSHAMQHTTIQELVQHSSTQTPLAPNTQRHHPENWWGKEVTCWKPRKSPAAPASNPESQPPSTSPLLFDEEDPLSEPEGNIAASSSEPTVGEFPAFPASNSKDVPQDGKSVKGNAKAPPQTPQSASSSNPPTSDDARPYVFIRGNLFEVPEAYPKGAKGWLVNDKQFIRELEELLVKDICNACARNTNPRAKPKASYTKSDLIYKRVFADFL